MIHLRADRTPFRFSGEDAGRLLHDVLTAHVEAGSDEGRWWALLSPQGKVQAEGLIGWADGAFWLDVHAGVAADFFKRMRLYRLRAKVEIEEVSEAFAVGWSGERPEGGIVHADPRGGGLGFRVVAPKREAAGWAQDPLPYARARIEAGVAELGPDFSADEAFPHDIAMDLHGGVDFAKGCFVGQEVVSRMKHRGTARRRPVIVTGLGDGAAAGDAVTVEGRAAGVLGAVAGGRAVAVLRLDRIGEAGGVEVGGAPVSLVLPQWAGYRFGDSTGGDG